jgi:hypothetical protein
MRSGLRSVAISCDKNFYNDRFAPPVDVQAPSEKASDASKALRKPVLCKKMNVVELAFCEVRGLRTKTPRRKISPFCGRHRIRTRCYAALRG